MTEQRGGWQTFGERLVYDNPWVQLGLVDVQAPNGQRMEYHVVHLSRVAIALIVNERDEVLMHWRYRFPIDRWGYELFGGMVEAGEHPARTAAREAAEESGWRPVGEPEHLISFEPLPGQVTAQIDVYLWRQAEYVGKPTDTEETGRLEWVQVSRVPELAQRQLIPGAGALVSLLSFVATHSTERRRQPTEPREKCIVEAYETIGGQYDQWNLCPAGQVQQRTIEAQLGDLTGRSVLDIGCGTGYYSRLFIAHGARRVLGLDSSTEMTPGHQQAAAQGDRVPVG